MGRIVYFGMIFLYTFLPLIGFWGAEETYPQFSFDFFSLRFASSVYTFLLYIAVFFALRTANKYGYNWHKTASIENGMLIKAFRRMRWIAFVFFLIFFFLVGIKTFSGEYRGDVRVSLGFWGWLVTFIKLYGFPAILSLSTLYYLYFSDERKMIKLLYLQIILLALLVAIMTGGKSNIVFMVLPILLQVNNQIKLKYWILIIVMGGLSIVIVGIYQMNMSLEDSFGYNIYRATSLAAYGAICTWDYYPSGAENPFLSLYNMFGENITSFLTSVNRHSVEFLVYSLPRKITYEYYGNYSGAISGTVNLTITSFADTVYWFGRKYCFIMFIPICILAYKLTLMIFKTRRYCCIKKNVMVNVYFVAVFLSWLNGGGGSIASLFGFTTIFYLVLTYFLLGCIVEKDLL